MRRDITLYWCGQTTSAFGSVFTAVALPVIAILHLGASPGQMGLIGAASTVPGLVAGLPAGALADRITRPRRTLLALDTVSALGVALLALGVANRVATIGWLVCLGVLEGCLSVLAGSLYFVHLRQLVDSAGASDGGIGPVRARLQAGQYGAALLGRILAGPVIVTFGSPAALAIDAASYLLSATALLGMKAPDRAPATAADRDSGGGFRRAVSGLRFFATHRYQRALLVFIVVPAAAMTGVGTLTGPFLLRVIHLPTAYYGLAFVLAGATGLAGSMAAGRVLAPHRDPRRLTILAFGCGMTCCLLLPLAAGPLLLAAGCAALGIGLPVFFGAIANVAVSSVLTADVEEGEMGRVSAALQLVLGLAAMLGALAGGMLGDRLGIRPALWTLCAVSLAAAALAGPQALRSARSAHLGPVTVPAAVAEVSGRPS
ncbi:MFS transporter [Streptacidiphilus sp. EB103A]|uniref:MFS transporter n=1 Tax=Streptacidiphilus sp. EB103A TaxID=3156275 RepID=UPI0035136E58